MVKYQSRAVYKFFSKKMPEKKSYSQKSSIQKIGLFLGPALFILALLMNIAPENPIASRMAAIAVLMAVWWITEAIPLAATSLLPLVLYPLLGIMTGKNTAPVYINSTIFFVFYHFFHP